MVFLIAIAAFSIGQRSQIILKSKSFEWVCYGFFMISFLMLQILAEMINKDYACYSKLKDISLFGFLVMIILALLFVLWSFNTLKANERRAFTESSIKECIDTLPVGVAFSDQQGRPYFVNYKIDELSRFVFGRNLLNALDFFDKEREKEFIPGVTLVRRHSEENMIIHAEGIWQIKKIPHGRIIETLANDVTEEYRLVNEIKENNKKIESLNKNLKAYSQNIDAFIREKELLAAKRKIHDDIGRSLIHFRLYMEAQDKTADERNELIHLWKQNIVLLKGGVKKGQKGSSWEKLVKAANSAGVDIQMTGKLPAEEKILALLTEILHESINNAILHGHAKTLFLDICEDHTHYHMTIKNDGTKPVGPIVEKGGLKNIRKLVEMEAGTVTIIDSHDFMMTIVLQKGGRYDI